MAVECPTCKYDLTGLPDGACPECGGEFTHAGLEALEQLNLTRAARRRDAIVTAITCCIGLPITCLCVGNTPQLLILLVPAALIVMVCSLVMFKPLVARWLVLMAALLASIYGASVTVQGVHRSVVGYRFTDHDWPLSARHGYGTPLAAHDALWLGPTYLVASVLVAALTWKFAAWRARRLALDRKDPPTQPPPARPEGPSADFARP